MATVHSSGRLPRDVMFMAMAWASSMRGTCNRLQVGAVVTLGDRIVSSGYNGAPKGQPHCGSDCNESNPCLNTIHAEDNALRWAYMHLGHNPKNGTLYVTHQPCVLCAERVVDAGITRVVYSEPYRCKKGYNYLVSHNVEVNECRIPMGALNAAFADSAIILE